MKLSNTMGTVLRTTLWALLLLGGSLCIHLLTYSTFVANNDLDHQRVFNEGYKVFSLTLPNELTFCDEKVPLNRLDVREKLDRELLVNTYWQSSTLLAHKRAARWFPLIETVMKREGVPDDLKYIAVIESGLSMMGRVVVGRAKFAELARAPQGAHSVEQREGVGVDGTVPRRAGRR